MSSTCWVVPFGNPRIKGHLHLPAAYRSLSRPSSPPRAKASTRRPNLLSPITSAIGKELCRWRSIAHTFSCNQLLRSSFSVYVRRTQFLISNLSQFTYSLVSQHVKDRCPGMQQHCCCKGRQVENNGFEPLTPCLQSRCSSQLS